ncbi:hypothetical protein COV19_03470 [Candidatus Woesearchaeota archaeon CG10_big_fil_rev_8_21_14_0_10_44_13]|nr:MAG: hypothetical protein COV19_03470 [Candidatus Woesearchaeota archaeon CG10_big_fil_rev_8_21_14_0_10_44_13]
MRLKKRLGWYEKINLVLPITASLLALWILSHNYEYLMNYGWIIYAFESIFLISVVFNVFLFLRKIRR